MSCDRRCFDEEWKYGEISCSECPGQDSGISIDGRRDLQKKLESKAKEETQQ